LLDQIHKLWTVLLAGWQWYLIFHHLRHRAHHVCLADISVVSSVLLNVPSVKP